MARCVRDGNSYKRHKFVNGKCRRCQQPETKTNVYPKPKQGGTNAENTDGK
jgi:hypothetical protein